MVGHCLLAWQHSYLFHPLLPSSLAYRSEVTLDRVLAELVVSASSKYFYRLAKLTSSASDSYCSSSTL